MQTQSLGLKRNGGILYTYEGISCDVFGISNINVGAFGMLKGRAGSIQASFFDSFLLIERASDTTGEFFNVYSRI